MPSATRTATVVAAALPLLVLLVGRHHDGSAAEPPSAQPIPVDCFVTSAYDYGYDPDSTAAFPDLDAAQAGLARQARELTAAADEHADPQFRAQADAALALSRPGTHRVVRGSSVLLTAFDQQHHVVAEATYGPPGIFLESTPADGYVLQSLTFPVEPLAGRTNCATPLAG
ncbi:hypothetical protein [Kineococcus sp. NPDC059986]|jgi:hypothetical protein|uniref:hypothetical protein n=1 Tax=Kineococcus sp. NPDC059986 TaxID=3155538 RepID=UPI00344E7B12